MTPSRFLLAVVALACFACTASAQSARDKRLESLGASTYVKALQLAGLVEGSKALKRVTCLVPADKDIDFVAPSTPDSARKFVLSQCIKGHHSKFTSGTAVHKEFQVMVDDESTCEGTTIRVERNEFQFDVTKAFLETIHRTDDTVFLLYRTISDKFSPINPTRL